MARPGNTAQLGAAARRLVRSCGHAALGTSLAGRPYVSLVAAACDMDASPLLLLSDLAQHTKNLAADPSVSLLFEDVAGHPDPLAGPRLTLLGRAERRDGPGALARFTARHPAAASYAGFGDFHLYRMEIERGHLVAGFGRINWIEARELRLSVDAGALAAVEPDILEHMNRDHADAIELFATRLIGRQGTGWHMTGIDPDGIDLRRPMEAGGETARLDFEIPVLTPAAARHTLAGLAQRARVIPGG
jgi:putative heme iron utilization protein